LESVYTARYPGFESLSLPHIYLDLDIKKNEDNLVSVLCVIRAWGQFVATLRQLTIASEDSKRHLAKQ
jgi:hypothetical protein